MGNWRRVWIVGTCDRNDVPKLKKSIVTNRETWEPFHPLAHYGSLAGLPMWAHEHINVVGNLAERNYTPEDVAETLRDIVKNVPSLYVDVHVGGDYESDECEATVACKAQKVTVTAPQTPAIPDIPPNQIQGNMMSAIMRSN